MTRQIFSLPVDANLSITALSCSRLLCLSFRSSASDFRPSLLSFSRLLRRRCWKIWQLHLQPRPCIQMILNEMQVTAPQLLLFYRASPCRHTHDTERDADSGPAPNTTSTGHRPTDKHDIERDADNGPAATATSTELRPTDTTTDSIRNRRKHAKIGVYSKVTYA